MMYVRPEIKKELSPHQRRFILENDSLDDGTICGLLKEDEIISRFVSPDFWKSCKNLEVLNIAVVVDNNGLIRIGKIKHDPGSKTLFVHKFNPNWGDIEFDLSAINSIYAIVYAMRECALS